MVGQITYSPGTRGEGIPHWQRVAEFAQREEPKTLSYWFLEDEEEEDVLINFERFTNPEAKQLHAKSDVIARNIQDQKHIRIGLKLRFWEESIESFCGLRV